MRKSAKLSGSAAAPAAVKREEEEQGGATQPAGNFVSSKDPALSQVQQDMAALRAARVERFDVRPPVEPAEMRQGEGVQVSLRTLIARSAPH